VRTNSGWDNFRRDIGGEFVGNHRAFTYFVPVAWLLSMAGYPIAGDTGSFLARMFANALAFALCYGILYLFRKTIFRDRFRRTINLFVVIAAGVLLGASKVSITAVLFSSITGDWSETSTLVTRVLAGAITGAWYLPLSAVILAIQDRYRTVRDVVFAVRMQQSQESLPTEISDPAQRKLAALLTQLREVISNQQAEPEVLAKSLTNLLEKKIRPFSRKLWSKSGRRQNDFSPIELARIVLSRSKYWPSLTTAAILVASAPLITSTVGLIEALGRLAILGLAGWLVCSALYRTKPGNAGRGLLVYLTGAASYAVVNEMVAWLIFGQFGAFSAPVDIFLNILVFAGLSMLLGILRLTRDELRDLEQEMGEIFGDNYFAGRMNLERSRMRQRELANIIHGKLQNQILGAVLALTKNPESSSSKQLLLEIEQLERQVSATDTIEPLNSPALLSKELAALASRWQGVVDVNMAQDLPTDMQADDVSACLMLAEEAVTNAVRHGLASNIKISVGKSNDHWNLVVSDDGVGPRNGPPRLGTLTLNHITANSWSLTPNPFGTGSLLQAHIPVGLHEKS
jgi:signal transduction histidine kinase